MSVTNLVEVRASLMPHEYPSPLVTITVNSTRDGRRLSHEVCLPKDEVFRLHAILKDAEYSLARLPDRQPPRTVLDIGANVGLFALYMKLAHPQAVIHCYEPVPSTLALLTRNIGSLGDIHVHPYALAKQAGEAEMHLHRRNTGQHSLYKIERGDVYGGVIRIPCRSAAAEFDALGQDSIDVLKIDTEGCELEILESLGERVEHVGQVLLEYHSEEDRRSIDRFLPGFVLYSAKASAIGRGTLKYINRQL
jgi:FkbM family methyltransferase